MLTYKVRFNNGDCAYVDADKVYTNCGGQYIDFYREKDLIAKVPSNNLLYMGVVDSQNEEGENING